MLAPEKPRGPSRATDNHRRNRVNKLVVEKDGGGPPITRSLTMEKLLDKESNSRRVYRAEAA